MSALHKFDWLLFFVLGAMAFWALGPGLNSSHEFQGDELRYISYAVSLHEHGVFALANKDLATPPPPGNANAPLYPMLIAGVMALDGGFADSMICLTAKGISAGCTENFQNFYIVQIALSILCLYFIYLTAYRFSHSPALGWLSAGLALASGIFFEFAYIFMTEILILPVFAALIFACLALYQDSKLRWIVAIAALLGVLTLIRPSYLYLFYGFTLFFIGAAIWHRDRLSALRLAALILGFIITVSPWALRNKIHFDSPTLTSGGYAEAILMQRINYNQMRWPEIGVAMIYYLPDFGDSLSKELFPPPLSAKLGWGKGTYYAQGYFKQVQNLSAELGGNDKVLPHLIRNEVLSPKHIAVSAPLAVRGMFIAKYWGLLGAIAFIALLIRTLRWHDRSILIMALPLFFMVAFHAGLSVSIPRYNLPLVTLYALSMGWYINLYGQKIVSKIRNP